MFLFSVKCLIKTSAQEIAFLWVNTKVIHTHKMRKGE